MRTISRSILALIASWIALTTPAYAQIVTYQSVTFSTTSVGLSASTITPQSGPQVTMCEGKLEGDAIRIRYDGGPPTSTVGTPVDVGNTIRIAGAANIANFRGIRDTTASADGVINFHCSAGPVAELTGTGGGGASAAGNVSIVEGGVTANVTVGGALSVDCATCSGTGVSAVDDAAFGIASSSFAPIGGVFATDSVNAGDAGAIRMSANRNMFVNIRDDAGNERGLNIDASGNANVVGTVTANAGTNLNTSALALESGGNLATIAGMFGTAGTADSQVVTVQGVASMTPLLATATLNAETTKVIGTVNVAASQTIAVTQATAANLNAQVVGAAASGAAKAGNPLQIGGVFNTTQPTVTSGQAVEAQTTSRGAQIVAPGVDNFAVQSAQSGTWTVQPGNTANTTPWLVGDGAGAFNVIVDSGALAATQSGTWTVQPGNTANTTPWLVGDGTGAFNVIVDSGTVASTQSGTWNIGTVTTLPGVVGTLTNNGAAPSTNNIGALTVVANAAAPTLTEGRLVALSSDLAGAIRVAGAVSCSNCTGSGASLVDQAAFGIGTDSVAPAGFLADQTAPDSVTEGNVGLARMLLNRVQLHAIWDAAGNERGASVTASNELLVNCPNCSGSGASAVDDAAFAVASGSVAPAGFLFDDTAPDSVNEGDVGLGRMSGNRNQYVTIRDAAGNERGLNVNASNAILTAQTGELPAGTQNIGDVDIVSFPANQPFNVAQINGVTVLMGNGVSGTGAQRVTIASDSTGTVASTQSGTWTVQPGNTANTTAWLIAGAAATDAAVVGNPVFVAGRGNSGTPTAMSANNDVTPLWLSLNGAENAILRDTTGDALTDDTLNAVKVTNSTAATATAYLTVRVSDGTTFSTLATDATHDSAASTTGPQVMAEFDDTTPDAVDEGDAGRLRISANRNLYTTLRDAAGNERGANVTASNELLVNCPNCSGSGASAVDDAAFTIASGTVAPAGFLADQTAPDSVNEGDVGLARMTLARIQLGTLWDAAGNERGANVNASNALLTAQTGELPAGTQNIGDVDIVGGTVAHDGVGTSINPLLIGGYASAAAPADVSADGDATRFWTLRNGAQVVNLAAGGTLITASGANLNQNIAQINGTAPTMNAGATAAGTLRVIEANNSALTVAVESIDARMFTYRTPIAPATATATTGVAVGAQYNATPPTFTDGQQGILQLSSTGALMVSGGGGGTQYQHDVALTVSTTIGTMAMGRASAAVPTDVSADNDAVLPWYLRSGAQATQPTYAGVLAVAGNGVAGTGVQRVTIASDSTGTVAATQSGTWTVQPGNTANTTPWLVGDGAGAFNVIVDSGTITTVSTVTTLSQLGGVALPIEDAAETAAGVGIYAMGVRRDTQASSAGTTGDNTMMSFDATGNLWIASAVLEDAAETAANPLLGVGTVRRDTAASSAGTTGDNATLNTDALGKLWVSGAFAEDAAHTSADIGISVLGRRIDTLAASSGTSGDYETFNMNAVGALYTTPGGALVHYRTSAGTTEDEHEIKATAGILYSVLITNTNAAARYIRCYDLTAANTTPGTSTVFWGAAIPGNTAGAGFVYEFPSGLTFATALTCAWTTGAADTDVAEVAANEIKATYTFR